MRPREDKATSEGMSLLDGLKQMNKWEIIEALKKGIWLNNLLLKEGDYTTTEVLCGWYMLDPGDSYSGEVRNPKNVDDLRFSLHLSMDEYPHIVKTFKNEDGNQVIRIKYNLSEDFKAVVKMYDSEKIYKKITVDVSTDYIPHLLDQDHYVDITIKENTPHDHSTTIVVHAIINPEF